MTEWRFRPARDIDLPIVARLRSHRRETGLAGIAAGTLWRSLVRFYLKAFHQLEVWGAENLPVEAPFVLVSNHTSHLDALCLEAALPASLARRAVALAAGNVFFANVAKAAFAATMLNALPIWRDTTSAGDLALLRARLSEDGMVFILFPEGTRARDGVMGRFRPGLGAFVAGTAVPIVPCWLEGAFACWPATRRLPRPGKLRLRIGVPLRFEDLADTRQGWQEVASAAECAVRALCVCPEGRLDQRPGDKANGVRN